MYETDREPKKTPENSYFIPYHILYLTLFIVQKHYEYNLILLKNPAIYTD